MKEIILEAQNRTKKAIKSNDKIAVPGILYGDGIEASIPVSFNRIDLKKVISAFGVNAKIWVKNNDSKKYGFIKEIQRHPVTREIAHIDVQIVSTDHEIKMQIPITYIGEEELKTRQLQLQVYKSEISVLGKMAIMPGSIEVDVTGKELGTSITLENLSLDSKLTIEKKDEVYGMITHLKKTIAEEAVVVETEA